MSFKFGKDSKVVIAGGGMAGLFAASTLLHFGVRDITIIEKSDHIGGLLRSIYHDDPLGDGVAYNFDYGTHFILKTGSPEIDRIIDQDIDEKNYYEFSGSLPEGQYINGRLYEDSGCANVTLFPSKILEKVKEELSQVVLHEKTPSQNLLELYSQKYGKTVAEEIYAPSLKKFTGRDLTDLGISLEAAFNNGRLIIGSREEAVDIKKDSAWDDVVAYANHRDGSSPIKKHYPKRGGVQKWMDAMESRLVDSGVKILKSSEITSAVWEGGRVKSLTINNDDTIACDYLMWTLPPIFLAKILDVDVPSMPPKMRSVSVVNIITDKKPVDGPYWLTIYDPDILSFRVTLYDNFTEKPKGNNYRISVEILHDKDFEGGEGDCKKIFEELKTMNILPADAQMMWFGHKLIPAGFSVLKPGDDAIYDEQLRGIDQAFNNVHAVSRYRGGGHGQIGIMQNIYQEISCLSQEKAA